MYRHSIALIVEVDGMRVHSIALNDPLESAISAYIDRAVQENDFKRTAAEHMAEEYRHQLSFYTVKPPKKRRFPWRIVRHGN